MPINPDIQAALQVASPKRGPINSPVPGRTDKIDMSVDGGSYIIPADCVSGLGEGNTQAGLQVLQQMFGAPSSKPFASGGSVPIVAAGGEFVVPSEKVTEIGSGDMKHGHDILDKFVVQVRKDTIKTLKTLPGPAKQ